MKVLVKAAGDAIFYATNGGWTPSKELAKDFGSIVSAAHFAQQLQEPVAIMLAFDDARYDLTLPQKATRLPSDRPAA